jgi:hypothetical protein
LADKGNDWGTAANWTQSQFIDFLLEHTNLTKITLRSDIYRDKIRYTWGTGVSPHEIALSLRENSYLTHSTALIVHGLKNSIPTETTYVNCEQSIKPQRGTLTQQGIDRAFKSPQRQSNYVFRYKGKKILLVNGKHTGNLGVIRLVGAAGEILELTNVERTLIDCAVRPAYAGGMNAVIEAFDRAKHHVSADQIVTTLRQLDYVYPYQQVIGFYMERAGFDEVSLTKIENLGINYDFYAMYGLSQTQYHRRWRLFYPGGM